MRPEPYTARRGRDRTYGRGSRGNPAVSGEVESPRRREVVRRDKVYHVTTFVPPDHVDRLLESVCRVVPLVYGPYSKSAWWSAVGTEQFEPQAGAAPAVGAAGQVERVPTVRLEIAIPADPELLERVLADGILAAHPWQTPAILVSEATAVVAI